MHTQLAPSHSHKQEQLCTRRSDAADDLLNMGSNKHVHFITRGMPGLSHAEHETTVDQTLPDLATYWAG